MSTHIPSAVSRQREIDAWTLVQQGCTQGEIAEQLGVSQPAVSKMLDRIELRVLGKFDKRVQREKVRQTAILNRAVKENLAAWEASKQQRIRGSRKTRTAAIGKRGVLGASSIEELQASENRHGDPRYLAEARAALADIRKIWGVNAPKVVHVDPPPANPFERLSDEELQQELARLEQQQQYLASRRSLQPPVDALFLP